MDLGIGLWYIGVYIMFSKSTCAYLSIILPLSHNNCHICKKYVPKISSLLASDATLIVFLQLYPLINTFYITLKLLFSTLRVL